MKYTNKDVDLENGLRREWLITNGIGGYASSTVIGANTRKYHGILVAPLAPPARRYLLFSKIDEAIEIDGTSYPLYTNLGKNYVSDGYQYLYSFEKEYIPIYTYVIQGITIKKFICMQHGKNTTTILYNIQNGDQRAKLKLAPLVNFRDFHSISKDKNFAVQQEINGRKVKIVMEDCPAHPVFMYVTEGKYVEHTNDIYRNMYYPEEEKRGFDAEENHVVPGVYEIDLEPNDIKSITMVCSMESNIEEIDARNIINREIVRISTELYDSDLVEDRDSVEYRHLMKEFIVASDNFLVKRPSFGLDTVIAGYPWFLDWGRDTLIAFEGLLLVPRRFEKAKSVLKCLAKNMRYGLIPNGYAEVDSTPLYNSADAALLLFEEVKKYLDYTKDYTFVQEHLFEKMKKIIEAYTIGIEEDENHIFMDDDYLISSGDENTQNTWMDAKIGNQPVTPRNGKVVEINAMWYNALCIMQELCNKFGKKDEAKDYGKLADKVEESFVEAFYNPDKKCLYDVVGDDKVRPNQLFALSLSYPVLDPTSDIAEEVMDTVTKKLKNSYGLKTLAKGEENYTDVYEGDAVKRDKSYHQGPTWPWLAGLYFDALTNRMKAEKNKARKRELEEERDKFVEEIEETFCKELEEGRTVGSISEMYDSRPPQIVRGTIAQAWSVSEIFRIIIRGKYRKI